MEWQEQLCQHCGNREEFEFEVLTTMRVPLGPCYDPEELLHNVGLPFNSRVWCRKCGKQGRWNSWQRGAYPVDPEMDERVPDYPINLEITEVEGKKVMPQDCPLCGSDIGPEGGCDWCNRSHGPSAEE